MVRGGDDERLEWAAIKRLGRREELTLSVETEDGKWRSVGDIDPDDFDSYDELWDWLDEYMDADNDSGGYWGGAATAVTVVTR